MLDPQALETLIAQRRDRHRARRVPRPPGPAHRQAGDRPLLPRPRLGGRRRDRGVQLPARGRRRHDAAARATSSRTGSRATATSAASPTSTTLRRIPWLETTALVLCDLVDEETGEPVEVSPRQILRRQIERAAALGFRVKIGVGARVLPVPGLATTRPRRSGYPDLTPHSDVDRGLPHPPDDPRRVPHPPDPQRHGRARASRSSSPRARPARASTRSTSRYADALKMADRHVDLQERRQGDRRRSTAGRSRSWRSTRWTRSARRATCTRACGTPTATTSLMWSDDGPTTCPPSFRGWLGGLVAHRPRARVDVRPVRELATSATSPSRGRRPRSRGATTTAPAATGSSATARRSASSRASPAPTRTRTSRSRRRSPPGCTASSNEHRAAADASSATRTTRPTSRTCRRTSSTRSTRSRRSEVAIAAFGAAVHHHLVNTARQEWATFNRAVTDWERRRNFEQF